MKRTLTREELKRLKAGGTGVRLVAPGRTASSTAAPDPPPHPISETPRPQVDVHVELDAVARELGTLVLEERATRADLIDALAEAMTRTPVAWEFEILERDRDGFIKRIRARPDLTIT